MAQEPFFPHPQDKYPVVYLEETDLELPDHVVNKGLRYTNFQLVATGGKCVIHRAAAGVSRRQTFDRRRVDGNLPGRNLGGVESGGPPSLTGIRTGRLPGASASGRTTLATTPASETSPRGHSTGTRTVR